MLRLSVEVRKGVDQKALAAYIRSGTNPWKASKSCWG